MHTVASQADAASDVLAFLRASAITWESISRSDRFVAETRHNAPTQRYSKIMDRVLVNALLKSYSHSNCLTCGPQ